MTPYLVHCSICTLIRLSSDHLLNFCHVPDTLSTSNTNRVAAEPQASVLTVKWTGFQVKCSELWRCHDSTCTGSGGCMNDGLDFSIRGRRL